MSRTLIWFSCGATSAVVGKLALVQYPDAIPIRIVIESEHKTNDYFCEDVQTWYGKPIVRLHTSHLTRMDHFKVLRYHRYINGPTGAKCTRELKREVREKFQQPGDLHIFGFGAGEADRVTDFRERNPDLKFESPLIEAVLTKDDCKRILEKIPIELPMMYRLGYSNNNCVGCVKGGMGYWNKIRVDFPEAFAEMAKIEREIGATCIRTKKEGSVYLDELDPKRGRFEEDEPGDCGPLCQVALEKVGIK